MTHGSGPSILGRRSVADPIAQGNPEMLDLLIGPLHYEFFRRALLGGLLVGAICAVIGTYVVLRGLAFIGDALAHAAFPGVVIAYLLKGNIYLGAALFTVATALGIGFVSRRARTSYDTTIGILFAGAFALGILLMSTIDGYTADLFSFLFGNILGMSTADLWVAGGLVAVVLLAVLLCYKELLLTVFRSGRRRGDGVPGAAARLPPAILGSGHDRGRNSSRRHRAGRGLAGHPKRHGVPPDRAVLSDDGPRRACLRAAAIVLGLYLSFYLNVASGAAVVLVSTALFFATLGFRRLAGNPAPPF